MLKPYLIKIGNFELRIYSLMYILALFLGIFVAKKDKISKSKGLTDKMIEDFAYLSMLGGIVGARIYYVILKWDYYSQNLSEIIKVWHGGLAIHGGIIGGLLVALIYSKIKNIKLGVITDLSVSPLILGQALGRIGNLFNGEIHGVPTITPISVILKGNFNKWYQEYNLLTPLQKLNVKEVVPWGIKFPLDSPAGSEFPNMYLHPAMIYEMILNFIAFFLLYFYFRKKKYKTGILTMMYLISYGIIRIIVSLFRAEDLYFLNIKAPYIISLIMIIIGIVGIIYINNKEKENV